MHDNCLDFWTTDENSFKQEISAHIQHIQTLQNQNKIYSELCTENDKKITDMNDQLLIAHV
jgi:hypothetical protein